MTVFWVIVTTAIGAVANGHVTVPADGVSVTGGPSVETSIPTQPTATMASAPARMRTAGRAPRTSADPTTHTAARVSATTAIAAGTDTR